MTVQRPPGPIIPLIDTPGRLASADYRRELFARSDRDVPLFDQVLSRSAKEGSESSNDDREPAQTPFELLRAPHVPQDPEFNISVCQAAADIVLDIVQQLSVSDDRGARRQVSLVLTEDTLPGVTLSVFEDGGRVVADFSCAVESSRACLQQIADRLAEELAVRLNRTTRICVRTDDPDDPCLYQREGAPAGTADDVGNDSHVDRQDGTHTVSVTTGSTANPDDERGREQHV